MGSFGRWPPWLHRMRRRGRWPTLRKGRFFSPFQTPFGGRAFLLECREEGPFTPPFEPISVTERPPTTRPRGAQVPEMSEAWRASDRRTVAASGVGMRGGWQRRATALGG